MAESLDGVTQDRFCLCGPMQRQIRTVRCGVSHPALKDDVWGGQCPGNPGVPGQVVCILQYLVFLHSVQRPANLSQKTSDKPIRKFTLNMAFGQSVWFSSAIRLTLDCSVVTSIVYLGNWGIAHLGYHWCESVLWRHKQWSSDSLDYLTLTSK